MKGNRVAFHTLGCKLNFAETSTIARLFETNGYEKVMFSEAADIYVINSCSVTENADKECRSLVRGIQRQNQNAFVVVIGCYAQLKPYEISSIEGVDLVLGAKEKFSILEYVEGLSGKQAGEVHNCEISEAGIFNSAWSAGDRTRTFLKVQDGCDYSCTFCTIPLARGNSRSDSINNVLDNIQKLKDQGVKEIVLTGINLGDFGKGSAGGKKKEETFFELVREIEAAETSIRFRISSIEPNLLTDEIIDFVATSKSFAPHFHIPLQSGSDKILGLMKRRYRSSLYSDRVKRIRERMPHASIGVDVITGFPGEGENEFNETLEFLKDLDVTYFHVFTYSERDNTEAIEMSEIVPKQVRKERTKKLRILSVKKQRDFYTRFSGSEQEVLFEEEKKAENMEGYTANYIRVSIPYSPELVNRFVQVKLSELMPSGNFSAHVLHLAEIS